jgi:hypothetical protein
MREDRCLIRRTVYVKIHHQLEIRRAVSIVNFMGAMTGATAALQATQAVFE